MIKNYFKIAFRNLARNKAFSFINIFGLAVGLATCLLIMLYIFDESRYDKHHKAGDRLFRIAAKTGKGETWAAVGKGARTSRQHKSRLGNEQVISKFIRRDCRLWEAVPRYGGYATSCAQCEQRLAATGISLRHSAQGLVLGAATTLGRNLFSKVLIGSTTRK